VIVGGGPTGVELAGAIAELAYNTLKNDFRTLTRLKPEFCCWKEWSASYRLIYQAYQLKQKHR